MDVSATKEISLRQVLHRSQESGLPPVFQKHGAHADFGLIFQAAAEKAESVHMLEVQVLTAHRQAAAV